MTESEYRYTKAEVDILIENAVGEAYYGLFEKLEPLIDGLITKRLIAFCEGHPAITSMDEEAKLGSCNCGEAQ